LQKFGAMKLDIPQILHAGTSEGIESEPNFPPNSRHRR